MDTSVRSSPLDCNYSGNSSRLDDSGRRDTSSDRPRVAVDYLGDNAAPQVGIGYLYDKDPDLVGTRHLGNADCRTKAV